MQPTPWAVPSRHVLLVFCVTTVSFLALLLGRDRSAQAFSEGSWSSVPLFSQYPPSWVGFHPCPTASIITSVVLMGLQYSVGSLRSLSLELRTQRSHTEPSLLMPWMPIATTVILFKTCKPNVFLTKPTGSSHYTHLGTETTIYPIAQARDWDPLNLSTPKWFSSPGHLVFSPGSL